MKVVAGALGRFSNSIVEVLEHIDEFLLIFLHESRQRFACLAKRECRRH